MPELPDVEVYRRYLERHGLRKRIDRIEFRDAARLLKATGEKPLQSKLQGARLTDTARHGKHLFARIEGNGWLTMHFGMTGRLAYGESEEEDPAHDRIVLRLAGGAHLAYNTRRKLGALALTDDPASFAREKKLGPDALSLDQAAFLGILEGRSGAVKGVLMNQGVLAGIGNVYSDEILFQARIHPGTPMEKLDLAERKRLFRALHTVLEKAIAAGADPERLPEGYLTPLRGKKKAECPHCGGPLRSFTSGGRRGWYCPCRQAEK